MKSVPITLLVSLAAFLAACDHMQEDSKAVADTAKEDGKAIADTTKENVKDTGQLVGDGLKAAATQARDNIKMTAQKVHAWVLEPPPGAGAPLPVKASYCYKTLQDILCFRQPMPNWEFRMVGYQGTDAIAPPAPIMQPLPMRDPDLSKLPVNRLAGAQPVFVALPPDVKEMSKDKSVSDEPQDVSHEPLPDPALAPQL